MSDSEDAKQQRAKARLNMALMSAERPLDALLPALRAPSIPTADVHPRVLELKNEEGAEWMLLVWSDPGGPKALHDQIQALVEATLLAELSRPAEVIAKQSERRFSGLRLVIFAELDWDPLPAIRAFGFRAVEPIFADDTQRAITDEAARAKQTVGAPTSVWRATIQRPPGALGDKLEQIDQMIAKRLGAERWGESPGRPSHILATYLSKTFGEVIRATPDGLDSLDLLVVQRAEDVIRWIPPMVFQAICDFIPVVAGSTYKAEISWAQSEDLGDGFSHPPLLRVDDGGTGIHIPIGHHVLRWWMMPLFPGDEVPGLAAWVDDQFGSTAAE